MGHKEKLSSLSERCIISITTLGADGLIWTPLRIALLGTEKSLNTFNFCVNIFSTFRLFSKCIKSMNHFLNFTQHEHDRSEFKWLSPDPRGSVFVSLGMNWTYLKSQWTFRPTL